MKQLYKPPIREYTQETIQRLVQSIQHLNYHVSTGTYHTDFETTYDDCKVTFTRTGLTYTNATEPEVSIPLTWTWIELTDAKVPQIAEMTQVPQSIIQSLGRTLRHWIDTL